MGPNENAGVVRFLFLFLLLHGKAPVAFMNFIFFCKSILVVLETQTYSSIKLLHENQELKLTVVVSLCKMSHLGKN